MMTLNTLAVSVCFTQKNIFASATATFA